MRNRKVVYLSIAKARLILIVFMLLFVCGKYDATGKEIVGVNHLIDSLKQRLLIIQPDTTRARTLVRLSGALVNESIRSSKLYGFDALKLSYNTELSERERLYIKAISYDALGLCYERSGDYTRGLYYLLLAQDLLKNMGADNTADYSKNLNSLGNLYMGPKKYDEAERYYLQALFLVKKIGPKKNVSALLSNIGAVYTSRKNFPKSILYYKLAIESAKQADYRSGATSALVNISSSYIENHEYDSAQKYVRLALEACEKLNNSYYTSVCFENAGKLALYYKKYDEAEQFLLKSKELVDEAGIKVIQIAVNEDLTNLYKQKKDFKRALKFQEILGQLKDSVLNEKVYQTINDAQITKEINKRDRQIELLYKDKEIADSKIRLETVLRNSLSIGIVLTLIVCVSLFSNVKNKRKANNILVVKNLQIESQQKLIETKNKELDSYNKELIVENVVAKYEILKSKINPHFLFNSLATLASIVKQDQNLATDYIGRFSELYRRILSSENKSLITLGEEMEVVEYYLFLEKMRFEDKLKVDIHIDPQLMKLYLPPFCLQMMLENAIKHNSITNAKKLHVNIFTEDGKICISNNLQKKHMAGASTLTGQKNVIGRYVLLTQETPLFIENDKEYIVKLPLIPTA